MIFHCYNIHDNSLVFKYASSKDNHDCLTGRNCLDKEFGSRCGSDRYLIIKRNQKLDLVFAICFDGIKVHKAAKFYAEHTIEMFLMANPIIDASHKQYEDIVKTSIHNTKNLNAQITSKILSHLNEEKLSSSKDKVAYIERIVSLDIKGFSREILSVLKMSTQISSEYNVIDYLKPNIVLRKNEFGYKKIHSLLVVSFYQFESEFNSMGIFVKIGHTNLSAYVNYNTVQTLLTHFFTNALRYCMPHADIKIKTESLSSSYVQVSFEMRSLYLTDDIIRNGRINGLRTEQAKKLHPKGTGMGLGIIDALCKLNHGEFRYCRASDREHQYNGYAYSDNLFSIKLLKEEFY
jgi:hypothetical protein